MSSCVAHFLTLSVAESSHSSLELKGLGSGRVLATVIKQLTGEAHWAQKGSWEDQMDWWEGRRIETHAVFWNSPHNQPNSLRNSGGARGSACAFTVYNLPEGQGERDVIILILYMETLRYRQIWEPIDSQDAHPNWTWRIWSFNYQVDLTLSKKIKVCSWYIDLLKYWSTAYW